MVEIEVKCIEHKTNESWKRQEQKRCRRYLAADSHPGKIKVKKSILTSSGKLNYIIITCFNATC